MDIRALGIVSSTGIAAGVGILGLGALARENQSGDATVAELGAGIGCIALGAYGLTAANSYVHPVHDYRPSVQPQVVGYGPAGHLAAEAVVAQPAGAHEESEPLIATLTDAEIANAKSQNTNKSHDRENTISNSEGSAQGDTSLPQQDNTSTGNHSDHAVSEVGYESADASLAAGDISSTSGYHSTGEDLPDDASSDANYHTAPQSLADSAISASTHYQSAVGDQAGDGSSDANYHTAPQSLADSAISASTHYQSAVGEQAGDASSDANYHTAPQSLADSAISASTHYQSAVGDQPGAASSEANYHTAPQSLAHSGISASTHYQSAVEDQAGAASSDAEYRSARESSAGSNISSPTQFHSAAQDQLGRPPSGTHFDSARSSRETSDVANLADLAGFEALRPEPHDAEPAFEDLLQFSNALEAKRQSHTPKPDPHRSELVDAPSALRTEGSDKAHDSSEKAQTRFDAVFAARQRFGFYK